MGHNSHRLTICTSCRHKGTNCSPGYALIAKLQVAIASAGDAVLKDFEISGVARLLGCDRPCTVAYYGTPKAIYFFGDIETDTDINDLVSFARKHAILADEWCSPADRYGCLDQSAPTRIPAAIIVLEDSDVRVS